jgi:hypothetical protein
VVSLVPFLSGYLFRELNGAQRTYFDTGLQTGRSPFSVPVRRISAKVAFLSAVFLKIPDGPAGIVGAGFHALHAADAFFSVDSSDVPMLDIDRQRFLGAGFQAGWINALSALL